MANAPHSFRRQVAARKEERPVVTFTLDSVSDTEVDEDGQPVVMRSDIFHATRPTEERLFMLAAAAGSEDSAASEAAAILDLLRDILPKEEFRTLRERMLDPEDDVNLTMIQDVIVWLMEEWSSFPTKPQSVSSASPTTTGAKSTGRVRGPGSTRSTSLSPVS